MKQKKALKLLILLVFLSIIPLFSLFRPTSSDPLNYYIPRLIIPQLLKTPQTIGTCGNKDYPKQTDNNSRIFWFVQATDTHLGEVSVLDNPELSSCQYLFFEGFFEEMKYIKPEFIVNTGDLVDGLPLIPFYQDPKQWAIYQQMVENWGMNASNYYDLIGNHDAYGDPDFHFYKTYSVQGKDHGQTQFAWNFTPGYGNYTFIALNSVDEGYVWPGGTFGDLSSSELDWFEQQLNQPQDSNLTFVFSHHPYYEIGDNYATSGKKFTELINEYNVTAHIYGHKHRNEQYTYNDTVYFCTDSLGKSSPPQYRIIAVDNDGLSSSLKTLGIWPAVVITSPLDEKVTTMTFDLNQTTAPVRALVFNNSKIDSVEFQIYNTTYEYIGDFIKILANQLLDFQIFNIPWEDIIPNYIIDWKSNWNSMYQTSDIQYVWNGTLNTNISNGYYYLRVRVNGHVEDSIRIHIGNNTKPKIVNGRIPQVNLVKNGIPKKIDLTKYEYDKYDNNSQLVWSVSGFPLPCVTYLNKDTDELYIIPVEGASGLSILTLTLRNSRGESESQILFVSVKDVTPKDDIYVGLWVATIIILTVAVISIYFRLKWLSKTKKERISENREFIFNLIFKFPFQLFKINYHKYNNLPEKI